MTSLFYSSTIEFFNLENAPQPILVSDLIPLVRAMYKPLITVYYFGENKIPKLKKTKGRADFFSAGLPSTDESRFYAKGGQKTYISVLFLTTEYGLFSFRYSFGKIQLYDKIRQLNRQLNRRPHRILQIHTAPKTPIT